MITALLYLTTNRPDIMFSVSVYARLQVYPKEFHLITMKIIFRFLNGTWDLGLYHPNYKGDLLLVG